MSCTALRKLLKAGERSADLTPIRRAASHRHRPVISRCRRPPTPRSWHGVAEVVVGWGYIPCWLVPRGCRGAYGHGVGPRAETAGSASGAKNWTYNGPD